MPLPRRGLAVALVTALLSLALSAAPASAAPTLSVVVTNGGVPGDPTLLDTVISVQTIDLAIGLSEGATNVTVTPSGVGLVFAQPSINYGGRPAGAFPAQLRVRATTAGFHTLTVTVTADGAAPAVLTVDRLWAPSDTHLPATGSLAGQIWGAQVPTDPGSRFVGGSMIWFLDADTAAIGNVRGGRPRCTEAVAWDAVGPCVNYAYDTATGLLELGRAIGVVRPDSIHLAGAGSDGFGGPFDFYSRAAFTFRLTSLPAGKRLDATFTFVTRVPIAKKKGRTLTLRKNGTFDLSSYYDERRRGTYAIKRDGRLVLRVKGRFGTKAETLLAVVGPSGVNPRKNGAWMTIFEDEGRTSYVDSNLLVIRK